MPYAHPNERVYKSDSNELMAKLRNALQVLVLPNSIEMMYNERSISFRCKLRLNVVKVDIYKNVYVDVMRNGKVKSTKYAFASQKETIDKTLELVYAWIAREELKLHLVK